MHLELHTTIDLLLKKLIMSTRVVEIWDGYKRASRKWYQLFFSQYWNTGPHTDPMTLKEISNPNLERHSHTVRFNGLKELVQNNLYGLAWHSYDNPRWWDYFSLINILSIFYKFCPPSLYSVHILKQSVHLLHFMSTFNILCPLSKILILSFVNLVQRLYILSTFS